MVRLLLVSGSIAVMLWSVACQHDAQGCSGPVVGMDSSASQMAENHTLGGRRLVDADEGLTLLQLGELDYNGDGIGDAVARTDCVLLNQRFLFDPSDTVPDAVCYEVVYGVEGRNDSFEAASADGSVCIGRPGGSLYRGGDTLPKGKATYYLAGVRGHSFRTVPTLEDWNQADLVVIRRKTPRNGIILDCGHRTSEEIRRGDGVVFPQLFFRVSPGEFWKATESRVYPDMDNPDVRE